MALNVETKFNYSVINNEIDNNLHLMVSLSAPEVLIDDETRPPLKICAAIDVSGSMGGTKIFTVKNSVKKLIDNLLPKDKLSIVIFSGTVKTITEGSLYCTRAFITMFELLSGKEKNDKVLKRGIFFTDGNPTAGVQEYSSLIDIVKNRPTNMSISTFGYGDDHDGELLGGFAKIGKGNSFYVDKDEECNEYFGAELGGLLTTYAKDISLKLTPNSGVNILKVLNDFDVKIIKGEDETAVQNIPERIQVLFNDDTGDAIVIKINDIMGEESRHVVLELNVSSYSDEQDLVDVDVLYTKCKTNKKYKTSATTSVSFDSSDNIQAVPDLSVEEQIMVLNSAQAQHSAQYIADQGNLEDAGALLEEFDNALTRSLCFNSSDKLKTLSSDIKGFRKDIRFYNNQVSTQMTYSKLSMSSGRTLSGKSKGIVTRGATLDSYITKNFTDNDKK